MARGGRYRQKPKNKSRIIQTIILLLMVASVLFLICARANRNEEDAAEFTESEVLDTLQATEQVFPKEESILHQTQITETTESIEPAAMEATMVNGTEVETMVDRVSDTQGANIAVSEEIPEGYESVLQQYREAIMMDPSEFNKLHGTETELDIWLSIDSLQSMVDEGEIDSVIEILERPTLSDRYPLVDGSTLSNAKMFDDDFDPSVYHYAYYNVDGKRSTELLIGEYNDYRDEYAIQAIYTYSDDGPRLLQSISDNARWHLTIYTDGTYCVDGSGGAALHHWNYYRIHEMFDLSMITASFDINYEAPRSEYMVSAIKEYEAMLTPVKDIVWHPLIEG